MEKSSACCKGQDRTDLYNIILNPNRRCDITAIAAVKNSDLLSEKMYSAQKSVLVGHAGKYIWLSYAEEGMFL